MWLHEQYPAWEESSIACVSVRKRSRSLGFKGSHCSVWCDAGHVLTCVSFRYSHVLVGRRNMRPAHNHWKLRPYYNSSCYRTVCARVTYSRAWKMSQPVNPLIVASRSLTSNNWCPLPFITWAHSSRCHFPPWPPSHIGRCLFVVLCRSFLRKPQFDPLSTEWNCDLQQETLEIKP